MKTGIVFHELYLWHDTGNHADYVPYGFPVEPFQHSENPDAKRRIKNLMEASGLYEKLFQITPRKATKDEILLFHTESHFEHIKSLNNSITIDAGITTPTGIGSFGSSVNVVGSQFVGGTLTVGGDLNVGVEYANFDSDGNPLGTQVTLTTNEAGSGTITITLIHEPMKPNDGLDSAGGETDIEVTFNVTVE